MVLESMFPFTASPSKGRKPIAVDVTKLNPSKVMNTKVIGLDVNSSLTSFSIIAKDRANFEPPSYDFDRIIQAVDTDSYVKQAFLKYKELFWKEGWEIISEDSDAVAYLWQRIELMEEVMRRPFNDYLMEVVDSLVKFGNAFVVEARGPIAPFFGGKLTPPEGKLPIAGYYTLPTETVRIYRNKFNKPLKYKQALSDTNNYNFNTINDPVFDAEEVIHLYLDKKPGRAFGTPFVISVLDDVVSFRQIEEDVLNMVHRELYPVYVYTVGDEKNPAGPNDVDDAAQQLNSMRVEGGLIVPGSHSVEVLGAEGKALDAGPYLDAIRTRVIAGLGLAPHHLGIMNQGGNRAVTDRLDIALYDKIKNIQDYIENTLRLFIFNPLLREGGFDLSADPRQEGPSSRCYMKFREIDKDTQIKWQTHIVNMFANNLIDLEEARMKLGEDSEYNIEHLLMTLTAHIQTAQQLAVQQQAAALTPTTTTQSKTATGGSSKSTTAPPAGIPKPTKPDAQAPSTTILPNTKNAKKGVGNQVRPSNQHGRRLSPNIRHMDDEVLFSIVELLESTEGEIHE